MALFKNKYRIESVRLKWWDYSAPGAYFVTICTKGMKNFFGEIEIDNKLYSTDETKALVKLNKAGKIVGNEWLQTAVIRNNVILDEFVVMPNHFHGIIFITNNVETTRRVVSPNADNNKKLGHHNVATHQVIAPRADNNNKISNHKETTQRVVSTGLKPNSLGSIIGQFKSICTKRIHEIGYSDFYWQERFYDHIIKDEKALNEIREYIFNNPIKWKYDKYYYP